MPPTPTPTSGPIPNLVSFQGRTFAFDYPQDWRIWSQSYGAGQETVVIANFLPETPGRGGLPPGAIKIDFYSTDDLSFQAEPPPRDAQLVDVSPSTVKFFLWPGGEVPWTIRGVLRAPDRMYIASVFMAADRPAIEAVAPILGSWRPLAP